ncbi:MAG TPA: hypothetical protein DCM05_05665 [Elusimicrobia bacterium]|nr:hypothetical protein [Elusimicrobiota bacterium]
MTTHERIQATIDRIERDEGVRVLYAVESGSRAWGFSSRDSDWDIRFIYLHSPDWYLSIQDQRDVLEYPLTEGLDVSGWDLRKTLRLFAKSNPPLFEWLASPIVYREAFSAAARLRELSAGFFSSRSCMHHYFRMAEGNYRDYLRGERVRVKKYFYVLRPILACRWIEAHGTMPPMEFDLLVKNGLPDGLRQVVSELTARKRSGEELDDGPRIPEINAFLDAEISRIGTQLISEDKPPPPDWKRLDELFREILAEAWEDTGRPSDK